MTRVCFDAVPLVESDVEFVLPRFDNGCRTAFVVHSVPLLEDRRVGEKSLPYHPEGGY